MKLNECNVVSQMTVLCVKIPSDGGKTENRRHGANTPSLPVPDHWQDLTAGREVRRKTAAGMDTSLKSYSKAWEKGVVVIEQRVKTGRVVWQGAQKGKTRDRHECARGDSGKQNVHPQPQQQLTPTRLTPTTRALRRRSLIYFFTPAYAVELKATP